MKKLSVYLFLLIAFVSCSTTDDSNDDNNNENPTDLVLEKTQAPGTENAFGSHYSDHPMEFMFENGQLSKWSISLATSFIRNEITRNNGLITSYDQNILSASGGEYYEFSFTYDENDNITEVDLSYATDFDKPVPNSLFFEYGNTSITMTDLNNTLNLVITKDSEGRLRTVANSQHTWTYSYSNGNLIEVRREDGKRIFFDYDDKRNPFRQESFMNLGEIEDIISISSTLQINRIMRSYNVYRNNNNVTAMSHNCQSSCFIEEQYSYDYNSDGLPTAKTLSQGGYQLTFDYQ